MLILGRTFILLLVLACQGSVQAGITGFHKWFVGAFPAAVTDSWYPRQQESFDHVCIDMNQILHVAMRKAADEDHAIRRIFRDVNLTLKRFPPRKSVVFAFDGSAPLAKLLVQRSRRENSKRISKYGMSSLHLSPGTTFMKDAASAMEYYAFQECTRPCYEGVQFYVSGADVPGEGELKCIDWLKNMSKPDSEESAVIVGGDADLILQGLALSEVKNIFIGSQTDAGSFRLSSIWEVIRSLEALFPGQAEFVRVDLAVLIMLNGNDYLPKVRGVSFDRCFRSYTAVKRGKHRDDFLVDGESRSISWDFLEDLLTDILSGRPAEAKGRTAVSLEQLDLNNRYPPAGSIFNSAVQQGKLGNGVEIRMRCLSEPVSEDQRESDEPFANGMKQWRSSTWVNGKEYSWVHTAAKEKTAKHEAAARLLEELVPDEYEKFLEREEARLIEQAQLDEENENTDLDMEEHFVEGSSSRTRRWADKEPLFDVQEYLSGVLWNLQMYIDGYVPNYYWRYSPRYSPSVADILSFIQSNPGSLTQVSPAVTEAPPLPAAVACLCMMPMTEVGKTFVPKRLQPLVNRGSPLLEALEWGGVSSGLDIPKILRIMYEEAPEELRDFHDGSFRSGWKVVFLDLSAPQGRPFPPAPPSKNFPSLDRNRRSSAYKFRRIQVTSLSATSAPRNLAWSFPSDPKWRNKPSVLDQPYKKPFTDEAKEIKRGRRSRGRGKTRSLGGKGRSAPPKSVAWRKNSRAARIRQGGWVGEGLDGREGARGKAEGTSAPSYPRRAPASEKRKARPTTFPHSARSDTRGSMCLGSSGSSALGRSWCRLLL